MSARFAELDWQQTPIGAVSLRRRVEPTLRVELYEVKLDDEYLMSSLFTDGEVALADLALAELPGDRLDVVVGGLGLGYTARAALADPRVASLMVVELLEPVLDWHRRGLLPAAASLTTDARCRLVRGDFFELAADAAGFDPDVPGRRVDAILLDIDHSPSHLLDDRSATFYSPAGLRRLVAHLRPGGVFGLWSNDPPDTAVTAMLAEVFRGAAAHVVRFANPLQGGEATNTVYLATA
ncbi:spermidine synthase [Actinocatenispora thailandica]|uniref:Spermidine synthase n=1 Tax=Actinocatenispora thailandica TaxID=227318 RepID=A0A7R7DT02_9ACTN|nr:spermidine synthase [Actinocatenispora thailandica]BCJ37258.1 spermidine synthase [Actinocatenispora thailandica]